MTSTEPMSKKDLLGMLGGQLPQMAKFIDEFKLTRRANSVLSGKGASKTGALSVLASNIIVISARASEGYRQTLEGADVDISALYATSGDTGTYSPFRRDANSGTEGATVFPNKIGDRTVLGGVYDRTAVMKGRLDLAMNLSAARAFITVIIEHAASHGHDKNPAFIALDKEHEGGAYKALEGYRDTLTKALFNLGELYGANTIVNTNYKGEPMAPQKIQSPERMFLKNFVPYLADPYVMDRAQDNKLQTAEKDKLRNRFVSVLRKGVSIFEQPRREEEQDVPAPRGVAPAVPGERAP